MKPEELSDWAVLEKYCKPAFDFLTATLDTMDRRHEEGMARIARMRKVLGDPEHMLVGDERRKAK